jgi:hypothetical protein
MFSREAQPSVVRGSQQYQFDSSEQVWRILGEFEGFRQLSTGAIVRFAVRRSAAERPPLPPLTKGGRHW